MSKYMFKYYVRCNHGVSAIECEACIVTGKTTGQVLPLPFDGENYTLDECQQHLTSCYCDGCKVYELLDGSKAAALRMKLQQTIFGNKA